MEKTKKTVDNVAEKAVEKKAAAVKAVKDVKETATKTATIPKIPNAIHAPTNDDNTPEKNFFILILFYY